MARTTETPGFASAIQKAAGGKAWEASRTVKDARGSFEDPEIDDGTYVARLTNGRTGSDKNGFPYAAFDFTVARGQFEGVTVSKFHSIRERGQRNVGQALDSLFIDLQRLSPDEDFSELDPEDIEGLVVDLVAEEPVVQIGVKNNTVGDKVYINVFINKKLEDTEAPPMNTGEEAIPVKGEFVSYKPPRARKWSEFKVTSVNKTKETVTLEGDDKTFKDVSWDDLTWSDDIPF